MTMLPLSEACAVLTAAGSGSRLGCEVPKALVELSGRPLFGGRPVAYVPGEWGRSS